MKKLFIILLTALFVFHFTDLKATGSKNTYQVIRVIDGDTIAISDNGRYQPIRLIGIDAPESKENPKVYRDIQRTHSSIKKILSLGDKASKHLKTLIRPGDTVSLEFDLSKTDSQRRRWYAYVYLSDGTFLNKKLADDGYVLQMTVPPNTRYAETFSQAISQAKRGLKGLWAEGLS